jgi:hypothetical protein
LYASAVLFALQGATLLRTGRNPAAAHDAGAGLPWWGLLFLALLCVGLAYAVALLGKIAWYSALIQESLERSENIKPRRAQDMYAILKGIAEERSKSPTGAASSQPRVALNYFLGDEGQTEGPLTLEELKRLAASGVISADTLVYLEGAEDWQPLGGRLAA